MNVLALSVGVGFCVAACGCQSAFGQSPSDEPELAPNLDAGRRNLSPDPLVLPQWLPAEAAALSAGRPANLGGGLWSDERFPLEEGAPVRRPSEPEEPALAVAAGPLPAFVLDMYAQSPEWCVDPQRLVDSRHRREIDRFLSQHARECQRPLKLWLVAKGQTLPTDFDESAWHRASFGEGRPGMLAIVWPGEAAATHVAVPPETESGRDRDALMAWRNAAVQSVSPSADPVRQVDELVLWLAIGLVKWEKNPPSAVATATVSAAASPANNRLPSRWWVGGGALTLALVAAWVVRRRWLHGADRCEFPEVAVAPRLGAPHCGGSGAVVSW